MPWKDRYTISDEQGMADSEIVWPDGAACSFTIHIPLDPLCGAEGLLPADFATTEAYFGMHGGLDAVRGVLAAHGLRATFVVSAALARSYPAVLRSLVEEGHEIAAHGYVREDVSGLGIAAERDRLSLTTATIADAVGQRPFGWYSLPRQSDAYGCGAVSDNTMSLLLEDGYRYMGNSPADDIPHYWVTEPGTASAILALPYYYHFDDQYFLLFPAKGTGLEHADVLERNWRAELSAQHGRGRSFNMVIHPYSIGWAHRLKMLDRFLGDARGLSGIWNARAIDCADHWLRQFPSAETLHLEPSIWVEYDDSLN